MSACRLLRTLDWIRSRCILTGAVLYLAYLALLPSLLHVQLRNCLNSPCISCNEVGM